MKPNQYLLLAASLIALAGCSSTPTKVNTGPIHAQTFSFVATSPKPLPDFADKRQPIHAMIQEAITKNLAAKGVKCVGSGGDVAVGYLLIVGNNGVTTSIDEYFGYGDDAAALHEKAHDAYTGSKNPNYFEAGTLVIDLVDAKSFKLLKRGYATRPVLRNLEADARAARIQGVVDQIFSDLRVAP